jgi:hypothetical protein
MGLCITFFARRPFVVCGRGRHEPRRPEIRCRSALRPGCWARRRGTGEMPSFSLDSGPIRRDDGAVRRRLSWRRMSCQWAGGHSRGATGMARAPLSCIAPWAHTRVQVCDLSDPRRRGLPTVHRLRPPNGPNGCFHAHSAWLSGARKAVCSTAGGRHGSAQNRKCDALVDPGE